MSKQMINVAVSLLAVLILTSHNVPSALAGPVSQPIACLEDYTVQTGDSISKVADKYYGDVLAFPAIATATNLVAEDESKYAAIEDINLIEVGQLLCIPSPEDAETLLNDLPAEAAPAAQSPAAVAPAAVAPAAVGGAIRFSHEATVTGQPFQLTLNPQVTGAIHYTLNGALPSATSTPYTGPIPVNESTVIRAQVFDPAGNPVSEVETKSYILGTYEQTIPVISIVTDWSHLDMINTNVEGRGADWERPINFEFFAPGGQAQLNVAAGIRLHGNFSRLYNPKKSYRIYFRKRYGGQDAIQFPFFPESTATGFDKLVLRALFQDSFTHRGIPERADRHHTAKFITDEVVRNLHKSMGQPIAHGRWVLLYLNGQFWGLYNMTERLDLQYAQAYSDPNSTWDVIAKESGFREGVWYSEEVVRDGSYGGWLDRQNWIGSADFTNPGNIGELEWQVDIENVFSYQFLLAYVQNTEWPSANWVVMQRTDPGAVGNERKWRMFIWDAEDSFGGGEDGRKDMNTLVRAYSPHDSITRILEKPFIGNCAFKHQFVNRAREYLGVENLSGRPANEVGQLSQDKVKAEILKQAAIVRPFIQMETERWAPDLPGPQIFEQNIQDALAFVDVREEVILNHLDILRYQTFTECK
ncbi:MAG: CotH kinase family protein [Anaerolineae bacterium]|nr:CotH kinase family protein [Anaerolineae bacterium]